MAEEAIEAIEKEKKPINQQMEKWTSHDSPEPLDCLHVATHSYTTHRFCRPALRQEGIEPVKKLDQQKETGHEGLTSLPFHAHPCISQHKKSLHSHEDVVMS